MRSFISAGLLAAAIAAPSLSKADSREGYYYPLVTSEETFSRTLGNPPPADRTVRANFITEITKAQLDAPESPRFVIFAKGQRSQHMVIIALDDEIFRTVFRARAVLAQLTSNARSTAFFQSNNLQYVATWFDLAKILDFKDIVISDGATWSHRVHLQP